MALLMHAPEWWLVLNAQKPAGGAQKNQTGRRNPPGMQEIESHWQTDEALQAKRVADQARPEPLHQRHSL
jgi:hypothetical protein